MGASREGILIPVFLARVYLNKFKMMKEHVRIIVLLVLLITISCNNSWDKSIESVKFPKEYTIEGEKFNLDEYYDFNMISVVDTFLLIGAERADKNLFHAFNARTGDMIGEIISRGRGPCEVVSAAIVPQTDVDETGILHIFDINMYSLLEIDLSQLILNPGYSCRREIVEVPVSSGPVTSIMYMGKDVILFENDRSRFSIYNRNTGEIIFIPYQSGSLSYNLKKENEKHLFYSGGLCFNSDLKRIVSAPYSVGQLDFYEFSGEHRSTVVFGEYGEIVKNIKDFNSEIVPSLMSLNLYTFNLFSDNKFIYVITTDPVLKRGSIMEYGTDFSNCRTLLLIFDWDGNAVKKIAFDRFLMQTGMDLKEKTIYGLAPSPNNGLEMYKYSLGLNEE